MTRTVPSLMAKLMERRGSLSRAVTFGEIGYVSTQELVLLIILLQEAERPNPILFYDGVDDTFAALLSRAPARSQNEVNPAREFDLTDLQQLPFPTRPPPH